MNDSRARAWSLIGVGLAATLVGVRTLSGSFLSDDVMLGFFLRRDIDSIAVDWSVVFADFARPWLGIDLPLYRPMVSVSLASDLELGSGAAWPFHLTNVLLHVIGALLVAMLARTLALKRRAIATLAAGTWFAVHPLAIEPVAWIAARNSSLEMVLHLATLLAFARYLRGGNRLARAAVPACAVLALATKESAIVLPVSLLAVDWLVRPHFPLALRLRPHLRLLPLWLGYLVLRVALGIGLGGGTTATPTDTRLDPSVWVDKLRALVAPPFLGLSPWWSLPAAIVTLLSIVVMVKRRARALTVCTVWLGAHLAPTLAMPLHAGLSGGRLLYGAMVPLALGVGAAAALRPRFLMPVACLAYLSFGIGGQRIVDRYRAAWSEMDRLRASLHEHRDVAQSSRPLVLTAAIPVLEGLPPFNHNGWFALAQRPLASRDSPLVSAGFVSTPTPGALDLYHDASALRALLDHGCTIATWDSANSRLLMRERAPTPRPSLALQPEPTESTRWRFAAPVPAEDYARITFAAPPGARSGTLRWLSAAGELPGELAGAKFEVPTDGAVDLDLTRALGPPSLATFGIPLAGVELRFDVDGPAREVRAHATLEELELAQPIAGATLDLTDAREALRPRTATQSATTRTIAITAMGAVSWRGEDPAAEEELTRALRALLAASSDTTVWYWHDSPRPLGMPGSARSPIDWFVLTR